MQFINFTGDYVDEQRFSVENGQNGVTSIFVSYFVNYATISIERMNLRLINWKRNTIDLL